MNLNWAPSADVNSNPGNPVIGVRSFGADTGLVARHTAAYVEGLQAAGVAACTKHFPGHGDTAVDSHHALPRIDVDLDTLHTRELVPFRAAVAAGSKAVMSAHILLPALDPTRPATLSPQILTGLLRQELGYEGLIVTDGMEMDAIAGDVRHRARIRPRHRHAAPTPSVWAAGWPTRKRCCGCATPW